MTRTDNTQGTGGAGSGSGSGGAGTGTGGSGGNTGPGRAGQLAIRYMAAVVGVGVGLILAASEWAISPGDVQLQAFACGLLATGVARSVQGRTRRTRRT